MISKKILPILIVLALILSIVICATGIYISKLEKANIIYNKELFAEKEAIKLELRQLSDNYGNIEVANEGLKQELVEAKTQMDSLYMALDQTVPKLSMLRVYRSQITKLKQDKSRMIRTNDSLLAVNVLMKDSLNLKDSQIKEYFKIKKALYDENLSLTAQIKKRKQLSFNATKGMGVKVKKSGKVVVSDKIKKIQKLKICTTISPDSQLISETKIVYFKVFDPKKVLLGKLVKAKNKTKPLFYSVMQKFFYQNQRMNICKFIEVDSSKLIPGEYTIEVYLNHELKDTSQFTLR